MNPDTEGPEAADHWATLQTKPGYTRSVCAAPSCAWHSPWFRSAERATNAGLAHTAATRTDPSNDPPTHF